MDPNRGSSPLDKGAVHRGTHAHGASYTIQCACRAVQSSGPAHEHAQVGSVLITSGLTAAQAEEIFLLSREVQTLLWEVGFGVH